ncbi:TAF5-like RNA polymerase II p300/CBP-associated factor-associated factor 65 kDa subunit 5L isoform X2 [Prorops nasuta]|uniref:TAF5-like RNA polymerase II p300/CBP-associated factor-associated factor 65 kDa subunit 5L isoform X2 n=1 Tax=Prorops nasuta TaxID=863751 RepID=UPI0034CFAA47
MTMKRSKSDLIHATVEAYLRRRHYQDSDFYQKTDRVPCWTSEEMILSLTAECATARENSIVFSAIGSDVVAADQAYQRFKLWVNCIRNDKLKTELKGLLYPIFCHLYLEMLHAGNRQAAIQFLKTHQSEFVMETEREFIEELSSVFSMQDIELRPMINAFKNKKYKVDMSDDAHSCLRQFLAKSGHISLMQIINTYITILKNVNTHQMDQEVDEIFSQKQETGINGHVEQASATGLDREARELQEASRILQNSAQQSIRIFKINNAVESASCGIITEDMNKLAVGFGSAEIRLWGINETVLLKPKCRPQPIPLACDLPEETNCIDNNEINEAGAVVLRGHTDVVHDLRFIPEAEVLVSVSSDKEMRAWRLSDYTCAAIYDGHSYPIWCMDTSAFNLYIATGSHDRTAKLWSLDRTFPLRIFAGHFLDVNSIKFHPNARYLATGSADKTVRLWDKDSSNLIRVLVGARSTVYSLAFSPNGKYIAAGCDDKLIYVWDIAANSVLTELKGHQDTVMNVDWSSDSSYIASASLDGVVCLWKTQSYFNTSNSTNLPTKLDGHQTYSPGCASILNFRYYDKNNSLVCIGTGKNS